MSDYLAAIVLTTRGVVIGWTILAALAILAAAGLAFMAGRSAAWRDVQAMEDQAAAAAAQRERDQAAALLDGDLWERP